MKRILFFAFYTFFIVLSSCTKEEAEKLECETENIGYVTMTCTSDNPYNIYIDGVYAFQIAGNSFRDRHELSVGTHTLKAEQESGYLLYPTVRETTLTIGQCEKRSWVFP